MKDLFSKLEESGISICEYEEKDILCGYELNTYTEGGVNQIIFIDYRDTDKDPKSESDFKELFTERIKSIDIDEEIELNRQDKAYRQDFTLSRAVDDFTDWKNKLVTLAEKL